MTHEQLKRLVNDCTYSEDGITYMSDKQFNNMSNYINELKRDNVKLKRAINKVIDYCNYTIKYMELFDEGEGYIATMEDVINIINKTLEEGK
jgi:hypothetical protein